MNAKLLPLLVLSTSLLWVASKAPAGHLAPDFNHILYHKVCNIVDVVKAALLANSYAIIVCHNHPSGSMVVPSREDLETTGQLFNAGKLLGVTLVDHLIVGPGLRKNSVYSIREHHPELWKPS